MVADGFFFKKIIAQSLFLKQADVLTKTSQGLSSYIVCNVLYLAADLLSIYKNEFNE